MRVVLDTNSLLVSIGRKSKYRPIFDAIRTGKIKLLVSNDVISEYRELLEQKANAIVADNVVDALIRSPDVEQVTIYFKWSAIYADQDDNKFVDCAMNGRAQLLVTDDRHFNILKRTGFPPVELIKTASFLRLVEQMT
ncbi:MAG: putative toxin-antitoxin system toxin component, PIN family [Bacteroidota bacterium]